MTPAIVVRTAAALMLVLVLQLELFSEVRLFGVMPELLLGLTVAAGWRGGPDRGATTGFAAGVLYDLYLPTPFGLTAAVYTLIGYGAGLVGEPIADHAERLVRRLFSIAGVAAGMMLFVITGELLGQTNLYTSDLVWVVIVASLYTSLFMPLVHRLVGWAFSRRDARHDAPVGLLK